MSDLSVPAVDLMLTNPIHPGANATKPTLLVLAQVDSIDPFHDSIQVGGGSRSDGTG